MTDGSFDETRLEALLGHSFRDRSLLAEALTHASSLEGHNERLEFLGDAVLNLIAAEALYRDFPDYREGRLTELKSQLVARRTLERAARRLGLEPYVRLGASLRSRRSIPRSVLGNTLEALLGAIYLDSDLDTAGAAAKRWLREDFADADRDGESRAAKQILQFYGQRSMGALPTYRVIERYEHPQATAFKVVAELAGRTYAAAWGSSKKEAERWAAWEAVLELRTDGQLPERA